MTTIATHKTHDIYNNYYYYLDNNDNHDYDNDNDKDMDNCKD